ncbi:MAG: CoA transferase [Clostridiales bacterium]|nr:CoA transferase [Clostridiales bacterium]
MEKKLPLEGLKVLDFTIALAGPFTAWQLADMGAEVWKIERYGSGDQCRTWDPFINDLGTMFVSYNKNKKSVEMNLGAPEGKAAIYEMAKQADVVIENFKSGSIDRLGLGYEKLREINPRIVFISLSGFGASGPLKKYPCYDAIAEARSGFAASNGELDGPPIKAGNCIGDVISGLYGLNAVLMALLEAQRTGQGCRIDMSMMDVGMQACEETIMDYGLTGSAQPRFGDHDRFTAPYGMFEARDGWAVLVADTEARWGALCDALGLAGLKEDPRFADNAARVANRDALVQEITAVTRTMKRSEIEQTLLAVDVPASSVLTFIEAYTSDHANAVGLTQLVDQPRIGTMRFYSNPIRFDDELIPIQRGAPLLGQDTTEVLRGLGYTQEQIDKLYADGVVASSMT